MSLELRSSFREKYDLGYEQRDGALLGVRALIKTSTHSLKRENYPKQSAKCTECGANVWKEIQ
jgi:hypothetical protein